MTRVCFSADIIKRAINRSPEGLGDVGGFIGA